MQQQQLQRQQQALVPPAAPTATAAAVVMPGSQVVSGWMAQASPLSAAAGPPPQGVMHMLEAHMHRHIIQVSELGRIETLLRHDKHVPIKVMQFSEGALQSLP
jgi:hypothetical protein